MGVIQVRRSWLFVLGLLLSILPPILWGQLDGWQANPPIQGALCMGEQSALVLAVYGFKLMYMLLSLGTLFLIWGERGQAWFALKGSLAAFWAGEFFCWINILFYTEETLVFEYLHSLLMVVCLGLLFYSVMEAIDINVLHFSDPRQRCALSGVCKKCIKAQPESRTTCFLLMLFKWMMPLSAVVALMPLLVKPLNFSLETQIFGQRRILTHLMPIQWYELRFSPIAAIALLVASWLLLIWPVKMGSWSLMRMRISKILLSFAAGHLGFSLMRQVFASFYKEELVWFIFWEELTELLLITGVLVVVWLIHPEQVARRQLKLREWFK